MFVEIPADEAVSRILKRPVILIMRSLNSARVAKPDGEVAESATSYIIELEEKGERISLFVCFYLINENRLLAYRAEEGSEHSIDTIDETEQEARAFVESMGFILTEIPFQTLKAERQVKLQRVLPIFFANCDLFLRRVRLGYDQETLEEFSDFLRLIEMSHFRMPGTALRNPVEILVRLLSIY